jgi:hypothetical protein
MPCGHAAQRVSTCKTLAANDRAEDLQH